MGRGRKEGDIVPPETAAGYLGATIRAWRRFRKLTVTELAVRAGLGETGRAYISKLEHGHIAHVGVTRLNHLAAALRTTPADLLTHQQPEMPARADASTPDGMRASVVRDAVAETLEEHLDSVLRSALASALPVFRRKADQVIEQSVPRILRITQREREAELFQSIIRQAAQGRPIIEHLGPTAPVPSQEIDGTEASIHAAMQLIESAPSLAAAHGREITLTWQGDKSLIEATADPFLRQRWIATLGGALERGWDIVHLVEIGANQQKPLLLVLNILALLGTRGFYRPYLLPASERRTGAARDAISVPDLGVVELLGLRHAIYYRPGEETAAIDCELARLAAVAIPLYKLHPRSSNGFFEAIARTEAAEGDRDLAMNGLSVSSMPHTISQERAWPILKRGGEDARLAAVILRARRDREQAILAQLGKYRFRDYCPEQAVLRMVREGFTSDDDSLTRLGAPALTVEQRLTHLRTIAERMRQHRSYELIVLPEYQADLCRTFYLAKAGRAVLLEFWSTTAEREDLPEERRLAGEREQVNIEVTEPAMVRAFYENPVWRPYRNASSERRQQTLAFLEEQIAWLLARR
jgi:transcriptional regulator with XRE-family HTH domain